ncbi:MAG: hypothetical protein M3O71_11415 [Bacteroidota bacterium]|nr:hypothetical protein [Bacteroidota bacterium]
MKSKSLIIELSILGLLILTICWLTGIFTTDPFDINLNDTYAVFSAQIIAFPILILVFVIYIIKEAFYQYRRKPQNIILLLVVFFINIGLLMFIKSLSVMSGLTDNVKGGTLYPPLSALPAHHSHSTSVRYGSLSDIVQILSYTQIFFLALLVIIAILTGRNWNSTKNVS